MKRELTDVSGEIDNLMKEVTSLLKQVDKAFDDAIVRQRVRYNISAKWEPYISWMPRKIGKRWYWHSPIYRKRLMTNNGNKWIYGTEFDVLRESK